VRRSWILGLAVLGGCGAPGAEAGGWCLVNDTPEAFEVRLEQRPRSPTGLEVTLAPVRGPLETFRLEARGTVPKPLVLRPGEVLCFPPLDPATASAAFWFELLPEGAPAHGEVAYLLYCDHAPLWSGPGPRLTGAFYAQHLPAPWRMRSPASGLLLLEPVPAAERRICVIL